jgi:hypothetical protein
MGIDLERRDHRYRLAGGVLALVSGIGMVYEVTIGPDWLAFPVMGGMTVALSLLVYSSKLWSERVLEES